jgi:HEAT repeat protein
MERRAIEALLHEALEADDRSAMSELARRLPALTPEAQRRLGETLRHGFWSGGEKRWHTLKPLDCARLATDPATWPVLALATLHRSGYVREAALAALADRPHPGALPFVLARANDWVPELRALAYGIVRGCLSASRASWWIGALGAVEALERGRRGDHAELVGAVHALLASPVGADALASGLASQDGPTRRRCARLVARHPSHRLLELMCRSADPTIRLAGLRTMLKTDRADAALLGRALTDRSLAVRRRAIIAALERDLLDSDALRRAHLFDASASVRYLVRARLLRLSPGLDIAAIYRAAIDERSGPHRRAAILGLGETGGPADVPVLARQLEDPARSLRRNAVFALRQLGDASAASLFVDRLADAAPAAALVELCELLPRAPEVCAIHVASWLRRHVQGLRTGPDPATRARLAAASRFARAALPPTVWGELELVIRTAG